MTDEDIDKRLLAALSGADAVEAEFRAYWGLGPSKRERTDELALLRAELERINQSSVETAAGLQSVKKEIAEIETKMARSRKQREVTPPPTRKSLRQQALMILKSARQDAGQAS